MNEPVKSKKGKNMGLLNLGILSSNTGDNSGNNRDNNNGNTAVFVQENHGGRGLKHKSRHQSNPKCDRKRDCD